MSIVGDLSPEGRTLIRALNNDRKLERGGFEGVPFHVAGPGTTGAARALRFPQPLVYDLIDKGLLYVTQRTYTVPPETIGRPFSCRLTSEGLTARATILAETPRALRMAA